MLLSIRVYFLPSARQLLWNLRGNYGHAANNINSHQHTKRAYWNFKVYCLSSKMWNINTL